MKPKTQKKETKKKTQKEEEKETRTFCLFVSFTNCFFFTSIVHHRRRHFVSPNRNPVLQRGYADRSNLYVNHSLS